MWYIILPYIFSWTYEPYVKAQLKPNVPGGQYPVKRRSPGKRTKSTSQEGNKTQREESTSAAPVTEPGKGDSTKKKQRMESTGAVPRRSRKTVKVQGTAAAPVTLKEANQGNSTFAVPRAVKADKEVKTVDLENTSAVPPLTKTVKVEIRSIEIERTVGNKIVRVEISGPPTVEVKNVRFVKRK